jgi:hypothetical protein
MFALEPSKYTHVTVEDVPELGSALAAVSEAAGRDELFASGMNTFDFSEDVEHRERSLRGDYLTLVSSIIGLTVAPRIRLTWSQPIRVPISFDILATRPSGSRPTPRWPVSGTHGVARQPWLGLRKLPIEQL